MRTARIDNTPRAAGTTPWRRWAVVGVLSLLLHLLALNWATGNFRMPAASKEEAPAVLQTTLVPPPAPPAAPRPKPVKVAHAVAKQPKPRPAPAAPPPTPAAAPDPVLAATASDTVMSSSDAAAAAAGAAADSGAGAPDLAALDTAAPAAATPDDDGYKFDPPPSATLEYDVQALREGQMVYGHGKIAWKLDGGQYKINGQAGILFFTLLDFGSHGQIDAFGIAPAQYTEKRFRRAQTETRFDRERKQISFSASAKSFPLQGGEQDRASIIWQLAAIGRGDAARFAPGAQIPLFIAGVRDGSTWNIQVLGEEEVHVGLGGVRTWHVRRAPRAGDKDQIIDIWLAPSRHWYPVKLRYTETNGEYLELSLSDIAAPAS